MWKIISVAVEVRQGTLSADGHWALDSTTTKETKEDEEEEEEEEAE